MSKERKRSRIAIALVALWVAFTVTLAGWWLIFGLRQLDIINQSNLEGAVQLHRHYQMLLWEGGILIASLRMHWPDLELVQTGDAMVLADARALDSVLTNLVHNAVTHGRATAVQVQVKPGAGGRINLVITDNGCGFPGDFKQLGKLFVR